MKIHCGCGWIGKLNDLQFANEHARCPKCQDYESLVKIFPDRNVWVYQKHDPNTEVTSEAFDGVMIDRFGDGFLIAAKPDGQVYFRRQGEFVVKDAAAEAAE